MFIRSLALLAALASSAIADVEFVTPAAGSIVAGAKTLSVAWKESGVKPPITTFTTYTMFLVAGGDEVESQVQIALGGQGTFSAGNTASGVIDITFGEEVTNAYFLKIMSATTGGTVTNYSPRFSISGMTGAFPANVLAGVKKVKGTAGPPTESNIVDPGSGSSNPEDSVYAIPFPSQSGKIMYAPMQGRPGSKITAKTASPRYQTSSVQLATTFLAPPRQTTTFTKSLTISVESRENLAAPAAHPTPDAMQKYLNRWKD